MSDGLPGCPCSICDDEVKPMPDNLRDRIAEAIYSTPLVRDALSFAELRDRIAKATYSTPLMWDAFSFDDLTDTAKALYLEQADAVIRELDMGIPCATNGCRMCQIARRHSEASSRLGQPYCNRCGIPHANECKRPADA